MHDLAGLGIADFDGGVIGDDHKPAAVGMSTNR